MVSETLLNSFSFDFFAPLKVYFGTQHARVYFIGHLLNQNVTTGSSMMLRKACLDAEGGLKAFGCYLAEDYFIGKALRDQ